MAADVAPKSSHLVIAGAGYAGLRVAQRVQSWIGSHPNLRATLIDHHDYHQLLTELPRVASGSRDDGAVRIPVGEVLSPEIRFVQTSVSSLDTRHRKLHTESGSIAYTQLVLALGSLPNDFDIPGLREHAVFLYSADGAQRVWDAVNVSMQQAGATRDPAEQERLLTFVVGGGGATGVEFAGGIAEKLPSLARTYGVPAHLCRVILVEAGTSIMVGSSRSLIEKAGKALHDLQVEVRTNAKIAAVDGGGLTLEDGTGVSAGVIVWAGGVKSAALEAGSDLVTGKDGRVQVDQFLRALHHPEIYVAGDMASLLDHRSGQSLPATAQVALNEGDAISHNLAAQYQGQPLQPFAFFNKGYVVSVGNRNGAADLPGGVTIGGRLAHILKDGIEWDYRKSVARGARG
jgi:NADH:ubiquinone reductase (H+-translocating)